MAKVKIIMKGIHNHNMLRRINSSRGGGDKGQIAKVNDLLKFNNDQSPEDLLP